METCLICMELKSKNIFGLHNRINDHYLCYECFIIWYIKNDHEKKCIICKDKINLNNLPEKIIKKIESKKKPIGRRYFKIIDNNKLIGKYFGKTPKQAASKAFSFLVKTNKNIKTFSIIECTKNSKNKIYKYTGKRIKIKNPYIRIFNKNNIQKVIKFNYYNLIYAK